MFLATEPGVFHVMSKIFNYFSDIESKLKRIEEDPEGSGTSHLSSCIQGVSSVANRAFDPLFERQVGRVYN